MRFLPIDFSALILVILATLATRTSADDINTMGVLATCTYPDGRQVSWVQGSVGMQASSRSAGEQASAEDRHSSGSLVDPATMRTGNEPWTLRWQAQLEPDEPGAYRFAVDCEGEVELTVDGKLQSLSQVANSSTRLGQPTALTASPVLLEVTLRSRAVTSSLSLFWEGPGFRFEPVPARVLTRIDGAERDAAARWVRGERTLQQLHCQRCHGDLAERGGGVYGTSWIHDQPPSLQQATHSLRREWVRAHLMADVPATPTADRKMPYYELSHDDAVAITEYLMSDDGQSEANLSGDDAAQDPTVDDDLESGRLHFFTLGCLACHTSQGVGGGEEDSLSTKHDLSHVGDKRPVDFFSRWLRNPASIDPEHSMPIFRLSDEEFRQLSVYLSTNRAGSSPQDERRSEFDSTSTELARERGKQLFLQKRCGACHQQPTVATASADEGKQPIVADLNAGAPEPPNWNLQMDWSKSCAAAPVVAAENELDVHAIKPRYGCTAQEASAMQHYVHTILMLGDRRAEFVQSRQVPCWIDRGCLACHEREQSLGLIGAVTNLGQMDPPLWAELDMLLPPTLSSIGDKMESATIVKRIEKPSDDPLRPWLKVRMPQFKLSEVQANAVAEWFVQADRVPEALLAADDPPSHAPDRDLLPNQRIEDRLHGGRLLSSHGFGCLSCHSLGAASPKSTAPGTRGPALDQLGQRVRRTWFERFLANPLRISRRMEMPSLRQPILGLLGSSLDRQTHTLWSVLNDPEFTPPPLDPVRTLRHSREQSDRRAIVMLDVTRDKQERMIRPLVIGLPDRQTLVFDSEHAGVVDWRIGDMASQITEGKSWYWQLAGESLLPEPMRQMGWQMTRKRHPWMLVRQGQWMAEIDGWEHLPDGIEFRYRLKFVESDARAAPITVRVRERIQALNVHNRTAMRREILADGLGPADQLFVRTMSNSEQVLIGTDAIEWPLNREAPRGAICLAEEFHGEFAADGSCQLLPTDRPGQVTAALIYQSDARPADHDLPAEDLTTTPASIVGEVPGFHAVRLPLPATMMPTGFSWDTEGRMYVSSLKGRVWQVVDTDHDGREDQAIVFSDELPTPYGVHAADQHVDVITKAALLRMFDSNQDGRADKTVAIAAGWGHTDDYHDWAVGLPRNENGHYLVALPCQQDDRDAAEARFRGRLLELRARVPTTDQPHLYTVHEFASGLRFPMGLALNRDNELFVTDNQGNYNPFNELNHIERGRDYGFVNRLERDGPRVEPTPPAVNVPHPWTRSVNGICFLDLDGEGTHTAEARHPFGPFTGQLVGCEYDTRRLIRISLEKVRGVWQGAAYPMSREPGEGATGFAGPVSCAVSPQGLLYVGSMRDSGWGGANNRGEVVQLSWSGENLSQGIAEVNAQSNGFSLRFMRPIHGGTDLAVERFRVTSYYRIATPAYGGEDVDRREETIVRIVPQADPYRVTIELELCEPGRVYEIRCAGPDAAGRHIFPAEAFYTLRQRPESMLE